jgi:tetratricopeptide (TPR) repeat protein
MQKALFIIHFSCLFSTLLFSQSIDQLKEYSDEQYEKGNFSIALKEFQRILLFDEEHQFNDIYDKIATIYYNIRDYNKAIEYYDFAWKAMQNDSIKNELTFRKILCYFQLKDYFLGLTELYDLPEQLSPYFERKKNLYFAICHFGLDDIYQSLQYFSQIVDSTGMTQIDSSFVQLNKVEKKYDPDKLEMMSIILPGLGQAYAGDLKSGLNSILLLGGIVTYAYHTMLVYSILDGTLVLTSWFYRYYTGGHRKAYELGVEKIQEKRNETYLQVMDIIRSKAYK